MANPITDNIDIWTSAQVPKANSGRGKNGNGSDNRSSYGIKKLRELILELAVRGKLVPQNPNDEPASVLLERISEEKTRLIKEGKIKKQEPLPEIGKDEKPFELPEGWGWARLTDCYDVRDGTHDSPKPQLKGFPLVTSKNLYSGRLDLTNVNFISKEDHLSIIERSRVDKDDILFAMIGSIGNPVIVDTDADFSIKNVALFKYYARRLSVPQYLKMFLEIAAAGMKENASGGVQSFVSLGKLRAHAIAFPPLAEQHRIVAKVDELMALCDRLEQGQADSNATHQTLVDNLLATLTTAANQAEFTETWQRIAEHFDTLFTTEYSIDQLKQTILQLAIMGKLVPQDPKDEPASVLLERITKEKTRLVKQGKIKKQDLLPEITEDDKRFELPNGWDWVRWDTIAMKIGDIDHKMPEQTADGFPYVSPRDFLPNNKIDLEGAKKISKDDFLRLAAKIQPQKGDIIYPRYGTIGENRLVETEKEFLASYSCCVIKTLHGFIEPKYQFIFSISTLARDQAKEAENKTTQANVGIKSIQNYLVPLPPLAEQRRIVAKVDELIAFCDALKTRLKDAQTTQGYLADVIVEQAVA